MNYDKFWRAFEFVEALVERVSYMVFVSAMALLALLGAAAVFVWVYGLVS